MGTHPGAGRESAVSLPRRAESVDSRRLGCAAAPPRPALPRIQGARLGAWRAGCLPRAAGLHCCRRSDVLFSRPEGTPRWKVVSLPARGQSLPDPTQPAYSEPRCSGFGNGGQRSGLLCITGEQEQWRGRGVALGRALTVPAPATGGCLGPPRLLRRVLRWALVLPVPVPGVSGKCCRKPLQMGIARTFQGPNGFWLRIRPLRR